jgi:hypothetical protein
VAGPRTLTAKIISSQEAGGTEVELRIDQALFAHARA